MFKKHVKQFQRVSVFTLTYSGHHALSKDQIKELNTHVRNFMRRLRRKKSYKIQYVRVLEIVKKGLGYYYHYHFLIDMPYVRQDTLSKEWYGVTGTSYVVDIRLLKDNKNRPVGQFWNRLPDKQKINHALSYVGKYLAKPMPGIDSDTYALHIYGQHFVESFTCFKGQNRTMKKGLVCSHCGEQLFYSETIPITRCNHSDSLISNFCVGDIT